MAIKINSMDFNEDQIKEYAVIGSVVLVAVWL